MSLDLDARRLVMSALLYYGVDAPVWSDRDFDAASKRVASGWAKLDPIRRWQLGSPEELLTSGYHIKVTQAAAHAAVAWGSRDFYHVGPWRVSKKFRVLWLPAPNFAPKG